MSNKVNSSTFIKGAAILGVATLLSKMLGLIYRIPYQNITGDLGYYVYMQVYPLYGTLLTFATAGFPIVISKIVSEKIALGDRQGVQKVLRVSFITLSITGCVTFALLYGGAEWIARAMGNDKLILPIRSVSFALLIVPPMAAIRGYFQGHQNMMPTAVSQVMEQTVRVTTIIFLAYWFMKTTGNEYLAGAGAVFGAFTGACASFLVLLFFWRKSRTVQGLSTTSPNRSSREDSAWQLIKNIVYYSLPICFGALALPLLQLTDSFTVANLLIKGGSLAEEANILKGIFDRGQPLVAFGAFFATALSLSLVPAIAEASARRDDAAIKSRTELALRLTLLIGLPTSIGLAVVAEPVNIMLYENNKGTTALIVLSFTTLFSTLGIASAGILQGIGQVMLPAKYLFVAVIIKIILNLILIPQLGITGAALATVLAYSASTILNLRAVRHYTRVRLSLKSFFVKPVLSVLIMGILVWLIQPITMKMLLGIITSHRLYYSIVAFIAVLFGVVIYGISLLWTGSITKKDMQSIPKLDKYVPFLDRLGLLRDA